MSNIIKDKELLRPFYFIVVAWGSEHLSYLANFCIPCLLAEGNLPSLSNRGRNRLLIATTEKDWEKLCHYKIFTLLDGVAVPELIVIDQPTHGYSVYDFMNRGYKKAIQRAINDKAYGIILTPDLLISNGSFSAVEKLAREGKSVILTAALRYGAEPVFSKLKKLRIVSEDSCLGEKGVPLSISGRELAIAGVSGLHTETLRFEWDSPYFSPFFTGLPGACWWRVENEDALILHTSSWAPVLIDYGAIEKHDSTTLDHWSIDGDYIFRNFGLSNDIYVVQDSDEIMLLSWTPMSFLNISLAPSLFSKVPGFYSFIKGALLRDAFLGPTSDPIKRLIFSIPIRIHGRSINKAWLEVELRSKSVMKLYFANDMSWARESAMWVVGVGYRVYAIFVGRWANRRRIIGMIKCALLRDPYARKYLKKRIRHYGRLLLGKSISG
jgi:hypothetical protein